MLRKIAIALTLTLALLAGLGFVMREEVGRLLAVTTLFDPERIVRNFSHMDEMFLTAPVPLGAKAVPLDGEPTALPQTLGATAVEDYLEDTATTSLLVLRDGRVVHEGYRLGTKPEDLRVSWSMAKSVLSLAIGVAVAEGRLSLDEEVQTHVPPLVGSAYEGVTLRQALNMTSGVTFDEDYLDFWSDINRMGRVLALGGSMDGFSADVSRREREPGTARRYVSIDTHVLAMTLRSATGRSLPDYVGEKVLGPLGLEGSAHYLTDGEGTAFALGGLNLRTRDYARLGQMVLDEGRAGGRQVVPAEWVRASTAASAPSATVADGFGYGYQWWVPDGTQGVALARGIYGQYLWIDRPRGVVIVKTSADRRFREPGRRERDMRFFDALAAAVAGTKVEEPRPDS